MKKLTYIIILAFVFSIRIYSQTTTYFTDTYVYKMPDLITKKWPVQWSTPKDINNVIQFDFSNSTVYLTTEKVKKAFLIKKSYPEIDLNSDWKTRNFICIDKDGNELEIDIQRKIIDNSINILFIEPYIELLSLYTIKKKEN